MEVQTTTKRREVAAARRLRPASPHVLEFSADGGGDHGPEIGRFPQDLRIEATHANGQISVWFDDAWWLESLRRWKDVSLHVHILPTPDALLHPMVLHELEMLRRLQLSWRLIGHCYLSDIAHPLLISRVAVNQYDEIRVINENRPVTESFETPPAKMTLAELFEAVRATQSAEKVSVPLLTRAPAPRK